MTQAALARKLRVYRSYVWRMEHGSNAPRMKMLKRVAKLFDLDIVWNGREFTLVKRVA